MHRKRSSRLLAPVCLALCLGVGATAAAAQPRTAKCVPDDNTGFWRDHGLTIKLSTRLQFNKALMRERIESKVDGGVAMLWGNVSSPQRIADAVRIAADTDGILCVQNHLKVGPPLPFEPANGYPQ